ncbi:hypothetical protein AVEN_135022-1 [Araneus ventricosus]|uniref:TIL domain-containing protein n=1 Tax=Araneus ventricosus TaxID=182803 RepID=A0A4Y2G7H8_ARAVE|nr:hypothetical protein AVEN_135022-1 [Araneus ventricosus]
MGCHSVIGVLFISVFMGSCGLKDSSDSEEFVGEHALSSRHLIDVNTEHEVQDYEVRKCPIGHWYNADNKRCYCTPPYYVVNDECILPRCPPRWAYDRFYRKCKRIMCILPGLKLKNGKCEKDVEFFSKLGLA